MIFNVAQLLKSAVGSTRQYDLDERISRLDEENRLTEPVTGTARLVRTNRGLLVSARLQTAVELECSRCLELYPQELRIKFDEEYIPIVDVETGLPANVPRDADTYTINDRHEVDLKAAFREYGELEIPMKPLCRPHCAGLCPECGANRNLESCDCRPDSGDLRFAALRALLGEADGAG